MTILPDPPAGRHRHRPDAAAARTDYSIGRDNVQFLGLDVHHPVFVVSSLTIITFVAGTLAFRDAAAGVFDALYVWLTSTFDWVFMGAANIFVLFCLLVVATPLGRVRLGGPDARPDYSAWSWLAMLFAAGIGIGLMFFGVAEPVDHFQNPPLGVDTADTAATQKLAIAAAIFHWGVHAWAMFAVVALSLAFAAYNLGLPLTLRSAFYPVLGEAVWGSGGPRHRHPRRIRHALRIGDLPGPGSRADRGGAGPSVRRAGDRHDQGPVESPASRPSHWRRSSRGWTRASSA